MIRLNPQVRTIVQFRHWLTIEQIVELARTIGGSYYMQTTGYENSSATIKFGATSHWTSGVLVVSTIYPGLEYFRTGNTPDGIPPEVHHSIYITTHHCFNRSHYTH